MIGLNRYQNLIYVYGFDAKKLESNPYNYKCEIEKHCMWSAGHFDKWGRV